MDQHQLGHAGGDDPCPPLRLHSITIRRLRSLYGVGPLPIQAGLTVLAGENDGGKSTCIDAIGFLLGGYAPDDRDRSHWATNDEAIEVEGAFYPLNASESVPPARFRARQERGSPRVCEMLDRVHCGLNARPEDLKLNDLKARMAELSIPSPGGQAKQPYEAAVQAWLDDRPDHEFAESWRPVSKEELARFPRFTRFSSADAPSPTATIERVAWRDIRPLLTEGPICDQLASISKAVDAEVSPRLQRVKEKIEQHCADIDAVEVKTALDFTKPVLHVQLQVRQHGEVVDLEKAGRGRRQRVVLAIHEANLRSMEDEAPTATEVLAYDEPDTQLDVTAQRLLFDILDRQARLDHAQVVVTTHSKNLIDMVPPQALLHFRLDDGLRTQVEALAGFGHVEELRFQAAVAEGLGLRNSVLLDERCFLVVEGDTEEHAIPELFRFVTGRSLVATGVHIMNTQGSGSMRNFVTTLARKWRRDVVLLVDADARGDHQNGVSEAWLAQLGLLEGAGAYFIGAKEFEDAFDDGLWLQALQTYFPATNGRPNWSRDELTALRQGSKKYSEALHSAVCQRRGDHTIRKPDLGYALAAACVQAGQIPPILRDCFEYVRDLARGSGSLAGDAVSTPCRDASDRPLLQERELRGPEEPTVSILESPAEATVWTALSFVQ